MARYIDADALREEINSLSVTLCGKELFGELAKHSVSQKIDEAPTADVTDTNVGNKSAWISVDERLPEPFVSVLTYMPGEAPHPTVHEGYLNKRGKWYAGGVDRLPDEVVMWMPMPEPPKGE
jgi:hypothetical protein